MSEQTPGSEPAISAAIITHEGKVLMVRRRVKEGSLSWQFPAGEVESGESASEAASREAREETGLNVSADKVLGERVHPNTGRTMIYVACAVESGSASVVDDEELDAIAWVSLAEIPEYVPYGLFGPVQEHLDSTLSK
ncbi:NUDIX hydrolase [Actinokineospora spheciospongiae]|uniref:NUDIX hydrolase n=1 Tax=Actinokineospora spheciospongiae TaxID=909613 RepID=UPI0015E82C0A|nr:NUDIX hydrolase [Actinokineospora spheciospongiae]